MAKKGKRYLEAVKLVDRMKAYPVDEAIDWQRKQILLNLMQQ